MKSLPNIQSIYSYRFADLFPNAALIRDTQKDLDDLIQQGVFQITRLLKNAEKAASNAQDIDPYAISQKTYASKKGSVVPRINRGSGRLTDRLLAQGLLTPAMLDELRSEWDKKSRNETTPTIDDEKSPKRGTRRKRKT